MAVFCSATCSTAFGGGSRGGRQAEPPRDTGYRNTLNRLYVFVGVVCLWQCTKECLTKFPHTPLTLPSPCMPPPSTLCLLLRVILIPSRASRLYLDPSPLQQCLLLLRGKKKVLIFGLKYWNGHGPFICIIFKVSQDSHLAAVHKIMQTDCNSQFTCSILDLRAV